MEGIMNMVVILKMLLASDKSLDAPVTKLKRKNTILYFC